MLETQDTTLKATYKASHLVQFFESDLALSNAVARFITMGLQEEAGLVVVATPAHLAGIEGVLSGLGADVEKLRSHGRLIFLDAESTLARFIKNGKPDPGLFKEVIGGVIQSLSTKYSNVYVYGEMVGLLWNTGNASGTLALERLWGDLARIHSFKLFYGYPLEAFKGAEDSQTQQKAPSLDAELQRRKKAEEALNDFFENSVVPLHWVGPDGVILRANRAELQLLGFSAEEYIGHSITEFHADAHVIQEILGCLSDGEAIRNFPARLKCKDGSIKNVLIDSNVYFENGKFVHTRCFTRDVTDQIRALEKVRELESNKQEEKFRLLVESVKDYAIFMLSPEGFITTWNEGARRFKQYSSEEIIGRHFSCFYTPEDIARRHPEEELRLATALGKYEEEGWRVRKDGSNFWANVVITALKDPAGNLLGFTKVTRDLTDRKKAEELRLEQLRQVTVQAQTQESEKTLDQIFARSPAFMTLLSVPDYRYLKSNEQHFKLMQKWDFLGKTVREVVPELEAQGFIKILDEVVRTGQAYIGKEMPVVYMDGEKSRTTYLDFVYQPLRRPNGEIYAISAQGNDVTEAVTAKRNFAELLEKTRQSEEQLRLLTNSIPQIAWMSNPDGHTFWYNKRWYEFTGLPMGRIEDRDAKSVLHPKFAEEVLLRSKHSLETGETFETEIPMRGADGKYRWFLSRMEPLRDSTGKIVRWFGTSTDIDERRRISEANQMIADASAVFSQSLDYEKVLQSLASIIVGRLADWCSIVIVVPEQGPREAAVAHPDPERLKLAQELFRDYPTDWTAPTGAPNVIRTGKSEIYPEIPDELLVSAAHDGRHLELLRSLQMKSVMVVPLLARGKVLGAITFIASDSGREYSESDLALAEELGKRAGVSVDNGLLYAEAQKAIRARDEFLSIASHELKTPLTSLKLQAQIRARDIKKGEYRRFAPEKLPRLIADDEKQVNRLTRLVDDMLDVSRVQSGKMSYSLERFDLNDLIQETLSRLSPQIEAAHANISFVHASPAVGDWDRFRIEQVFINLLTNALKYAAGSAIEVRSSVSGNYAEFSVTDHGMGIRIEDQERIFGQFERAIDSNSITGLGLGLYISRRIVEAHGGQILVKSQPEKGSTFTVILPMETTLRQGLPVRSKENLTSVSSQG